MTMNLICKNLRAGSYDIIILWLNSPQDGWPSGLSYPSGHLDEFISIIIIIIIIWCLLRPKEKKKKERNEIELQDPKILLIRFATLCHLSVDCI
jgi:hypothetical protein